MGVRAALLFGGRVLVFRFLCVWEEGVNLILSILRGPSLAFPGPSKPDEKHGPDESFQLLLVLSILATSILFTLEGALGGLEMDYRKGTFRNIEGIFVFRSSLALLVPSKLYEMKVQVHGFQLS